MLRTLLLLPFIIIGIVGCSDVAPQPVPSPDLTSEQAKTALIELMNSPNLGDLKEYSIVEIRDAELTPVKNDPNLVFCGPIVIRLKEQEYRTQMVWGNPGGRDIRNFRGSFEFRNGNWHALPPVLESRIQE
jgi:hypothetical protein